MKILILGAAGQIGSMLTERLLAETDHQLILYARNAVRRLHIQEPYREKIVSGDFEDTATLAQAMQDVDLVFLNDMTYPEPTQNIIEVMKQEKKSWIICASVLGIYDEVVGEFGKWNVRMVGQRAVNRHKESARIVEASGLHYTLLRLTWLYNQKGNENYEISQKGEPFTGAQVTREAVVRLIMDILSDPEKYRNNSLGVVEPNTNWSKPSFY
ncbi:NAD(P)H-binding protein [Gracilibacillus timonensis]|uniref:NAD(P)H-binding protein n=1 Tax=Gracilibacillus timonensis TaxID=1816696 RepID=UPI000826AEC3|nr:NAD(P)H-binding protein [Gracilibacillus timonensis]